MFVCCCCSHIFNLYFIFIYESRCVLAPCAGFAKRTFIPYAETFGDSFVQGRVERVDTDRQMVVLQGGAVRTV